jgi:transcriptional regulator with XRE-family HTH domain
VDVTQRHADSNSVDHVFAERLRAALKAKCWAPAKLAKESGLPRISVTAYLKGTSVPSTVEARRLAFVLEFPFDQLGQAAPSRMLPTLDADSDEPFIGYLHVENEPDALLILRRRMPNSLALDIINLLNEAGIFRA